MDFVWDKELLARLTGPSDPEATKAIDALFEPVDWGWFGLLRRGGPDLLIAVLMFGNGALRIREALERVEEWEWNRIYAEHLAACLFCGCNKCGCAKRYRAVWWTPVMTTMMAWNNTRLRSNEFFEEWRRVGGYWTPRTAATSSTPTRAQLRRALSRSNLASAGSRSRRDKGQQR